MSRISADSTPVRKDVTAVIITMEVMIVLEVIVSCRWSPVALAYASPETIWLRVESEYIFHHKYPIPEYSTINGNHDGHSSREDPKSENNAVKLTALLFIVHNDKGWSNVTIGATSYFAAWLHMDESLYSQDFLGLSQWQDLGYDMPVSPFWWMFFIILA